MLSRPTAPPTGSLPTQLHMLSLPPRCRGTPTPYPVSSRCVRFPTDERPRVGRAAAAGGVPRAQRGDLAPAARGGAQRPVLTTQQPNRRCTINSQPPVRAARWVRTCGQSALEKWDGGGSRRAGLVADAAWRHGRGCSWCWWSNTLWSVCDLGGNSFGVRYGGRATCLEAPAGRRARP